MAEKKKTQTKKSKKIKLTYQPLGFNAPEITFPLRKKDADGRNIPLIKGLPMEFTVKKGEIVEVTEKQYKQLQGENCVETEKEYEARRKFLANMTNQYPQTFADLEAAEKKGGLISSVESQRMIYNDKLIRCD